MGKCSQGKNIGFICREPEAGGFCVPASYKTSLSGRARDSLLAEFPSFPLTQIPANMIFTLLCEVTRHWERTRTWLSPSSVVVCMTLNKLPTLLRIWSIKWEQSPVTPVSEPPVGIKKRLSPENLEIQSPWPEDIYNWLLLYTALCRSHMVAAHGPIKSKGHQNTVTFPLDELLELIDRLFMSHNRKLREQSPRARMNSLRKYFLLNWHHYFYAWWLESTLNGTAIKTHAKCFLITLKKRSGTGSRNGKQMGGSVAGVNRRIRVNEFLRWYQVSIRIPLLLCISLYVTWMKTGDIWISFSSDICWAE